MFYFSVPCHSCPCKILPSAWSSPPIHRAGQSGHAATFIWDKVEAAPGKAPKSQSMVCPAAQNREDKTGLSNASSAMSGAGFGTHLAPSTARVCVGQGTSQPLERRWTGASQISIQLNTSLLFPSPCFALRIWGVGDVEPGPQFLQSWFLLSVLQRSLLSPLFL